MPAPSASGASESRTAEAACLAGDPGRCRDAWRALQDRPLSATPTRLAAVLEAGCAASQAEACRLLATLRRDSPSFRDTAAETKARLQKACDLGDGVACVSGLEPRDGSGTKGMAAPPTRAVIEKACLGGEGMSCVGASMIATLVDHDPAAARDWSKRALEGMEAACFAGETASCEQVAGFAPMSGTRLEPMRYRLWLETGCRDHAVDTCKSLAMSSPQLGAEARRALVQRACDAERADACFALLAGPLVDPKLTETARAALTKRALQAARAQCDLGDPSACTLLAEHLSDPVVDEAEQRKLTDWLEPTCRTNMIICAKLAQSLARGNVALRDAARIVRLEDEACKRGYPFTCRDPLAVLGLFPRIHASFVDTTQGLEWAPVDSGELGLDEAEKHCAALPTEGGAPFRLPTRPELETLTKPAKDRRRVFTFMLFPHRGALFSSDVEGSGLRVRYDTATGDVFATARADRGPAACVRKRGPEPVAGRPLVRFTMIGDRVAFAVTDATGKAAGKPRPLAQLEAETDAFVARHGEGPIDIDVAADVDWRGVAAFASEIEKRRTRIGTVRVRGEGPAGSDLPPR